MGVTHRDTLFDRAPCEVRETTQNIFHTLFLDGTYYNTYSYLAPTLLGITDEHFSNNSKQTLDEQKRADYRNIISTATELKFRLQI